MQTALATEPGGDRANEDCAVCGPGWAVVLDGATPARGVDSGCIHDVPWLVQHLATAMAEGLMLSDAPLADILAGAIERACKAHADSCDLANPDSPSSTAAMIRVRGARLEYLVLGDSQVALCRRGGDIFRVHDDRTDHLPGGRPYSVELVRESRNSAGGFWVASTNVQAAYEALSGTQDDVTEAAMLTDGVTRLADWYGWTWERMIGVLRHQGPAALIRCVRKAEDSQGVPLGKLHDDATAVWVTGLHNAVAPPA